MGITYRTGNGNKKYFQFVPLLGGLFSADAGTLAAIAEARKHVEATNKDTFEGDRGDSKSARALKWLDEQGIGPATLDGKLTGVAYYEKRYDEHKPPLRKLLVELTDGNEKYVVATDLGNAGAQMLVRKLANAAPGSHVVAGMFSIREPNEKSGVVYTNHRAFLKADGKEVREADGLWEQQKQVADDVRARLQDIGAPAEAISASVRNKVTELHADWLRTLIGPKFKSDAEAIGDKTPVVAEEGEDFTFDAADATPATAAPRG